MAYIDQENVDRRLRGGNYILSWCNALDRTLTESGSAPAISRLITGLVPIKHLWDLITELVRTASPFVTTIDEMYEWVVVGSASTTAYNDSVSNKGNLRVVLRECVVMAKNQC